MIAGKNRFFMNAPAAIGTQDGNADVASTFCRALLMEGLGPN
jgi:hypothetical protein